MEQGNDLVVAIEQENYDEEVENVNQKLIMYMDVNFKI